MTDLIFRPIEGRNFGVASSDSSVQIRFVATLDGGNQQSQVSGISPTRLSFHYDLAWTLSESSFAELESRNATVNVKVYEIKTCGDALIGELELTIDDADKYCGSDNDDSRRDVAEWRDLKSVQQISPPQLLCSLLAEKGSPGRTSNSDYQPVLNETQGYFLLGPEALADVTLYFNVIILAPIGVQQPNTDEELFLSYQLFGNEVRTDCFRQSEHYVQEIATAKIWTSIETASAFFSGIEPITFTFCGAQSNRQLAKCQADYASAFKGYPDPASTLRDGKFVEYNTSLEADKSLSAGQRPPHLLVRLSLGSLPEDALSVVNSYMEHISINDESPTRSGSVASQGGGGGGGGRPGSSSSKVFSTPQIDKTDRDPRKRETNRNKAIESLAVSPHFAPVAQLMNEQRSNVAEEGGVTEKDPDLTVESEFVQSQQFLRPETKSISSQHKYRFRIAVKSLGLVSSSTQPCKCLLRFEKWMLPLDTIKKTAVNIKPSHTLTNPTMNDVSDMSKEFTFAAQPRKVADQFDRGTIVLLVEKVSNVGMPNEKVGQVEIRLKQLRPNNDPQVLTAKVLDSDNVQVGLAKVELSIADEGEVGGLESDMLEAPPTVGYHSESLEEMRKRVVEELEEWKRNQKKRFHEKLKLKEQEHLKALSEEWRKRLNKEKAEYDKKLAIVEAEDIKLATEIKKNAAWKKRQEAQFNAREAKIAQWEAQVASKTQDLALRESEVSKREAQNVRAEKALLGKRKLLEEKESREAELKRQVEQLQEKNAELVKYVGVRNGSSQENKLYLSNPGSTIPAKSVASSESSAGTPCLIDSVKRVEEVENVLAKTGIYDDEDKLMKMIKKQRSSSMKK